MRMFVALVPPAKVVEDLGEFLRPRQDCGPQLRWTSPEQWHVTLAFMPQVADRHLDDLVARLQRAAARRTAFPLAVAGGGAFPNPARAKVVYAGLRLDALEELDRLATGARAAANKAGAATTGGRFHPHVTVARVRGTMEATRWLRVLDAYQGPGWTAAEITLVESHLGEGPRNRPRHEVVDRFPLTPPAPVRA